MFTSLGDLAIRAVRLFKQSRRRWCRSEVPLPRLMTRVRAKMNDQPMGGAACLPICHDIGHMTREVVVFCNKRKPVVTESGPSSRPPILSKKDYTKTADHGVSSGCVIFSSLTIFHSRILGWVSFQAPPKLKNEHVCFYRKIGGIKRTADLSALTAFVPNGRWQIFRKLKRKY